MKPKMTSEILESVIHSAFKKAFNVDVSDKIEEDPIDMSFFFGEDSAMFYVDFEPKDKLLPYFDAPICFAISTLPDGRIDIISSLGSGCSDPATADALCEEYGTTPFSNVWSIDNVPDEEDPLNMICVLEYKTVPELIEKISTALQFFKYPLFIEDITQILKFYQG